jgi:large subunit ribosomal protein L31
VTARRAVSERYAHARPEFLRPGITSHGLLAPENTLSSHAFDNGGQIRYNNTDMKSSIHPTTYRPVVFSDDVAGFAFLTQSTAQTNDTIKWEDGNEYPLVKVHISSASHPFFTGEEKIIDTEGRVDRFKAKFAAAQARKEALANKAKKANAKKVQKATAEK